MPLVLALKDKEKLFINDQTLLIHLSNDQITLTNLGNNSNTVCELDVIKEVIAGVCLKFCDVKSGYARIVFFTDFKNKIYRENYMDKTMK